MKKLKQHLFFSDDAVRSVLRGHKITAQCGEVRVLTREAFDVVGRTCQKCLKVALNDFDRFTVDSPRGWTALLERVWILEHTPPTASATWYCTISTNATTWTAIDPKSTATTNDKEEQS